MKNVLGLLTKQEALDLLPCGRRGFENLIKKGDIGFKKISGRYYFLKSDIERWVNDLEYHIKSTKEEIISGRISLSKPQTEKPLGLEYRLEKLMQEKQKVSVYKKSQNCNCKRKENKVNCLV